MFREDNMRIDLHMHTTFSDSSMKPEDVEEVMINKNDFSVVTDHNTPLYHKHFKGISSFKGEEISAWIEINGHKVSFEFILYGFEEQDFEILELSYLQRKRSEEVFEMLKDIAIKKNCKLPNNATLLKEHSSLTKTLLEYMTKEKEINEKILGAPLNNPTELIFALTGHNRLTSTALPEETYYKNILNKIKHIRERCNALLFLAHPFHHRPFTNKLMRLVFNSVDGYECLHWSASEEEANQLLEYCKVNNKLSSGGSDNHNNFFVETPYLHLLTKYRKQFKWVEELSQRR